MDLRSKNIIGTTRKSFVERAYQVPQLVSHSLSNRDPMFSLFWLCIQIGRRHFHSPSQLLAAHRHFFNRRVAVVFGEQTVADLGTVKDSQQLTAGTLGQSGAGPAASGLWNDCGGSWVPNKKTQSWSTSRRVEAMTASWNGNRWNWIAGSQRARCYR